MRIQTVLNAFLTAVLWLSVAPFSALAAEDPYLELVAFEQEYCHSAGDCRVFMGNCNAKLLKNYETSISARREFLESLTPKVRAAMVENVQDGFIIEIPEAVNDKKCVFRFRRQIRESDLLDI